jgi:hypothetical protein
LEVRGIEVTLRSQSTDSRQYLKVALFEALEGLRGSGCQLLESLLRSCPTRERVRQAAASDRVEVCKVQAAAESRLTWNEPPEILVDVVLVIVHSLSAVDANAHSGMVRVFVELELDASTGNKN